MFRLSFAIAAASLSSLLLSGSGYSATAEAANEHVDPLALAVLRAVAEPLSQAQTFTFQALISEEQRATNGQIVTFFHTVDIAVRRPDKVHLVFRGRGEQVDFFGSRGSITMYAPASKLYAVTPAKNTIDENLSDLYAKGVDMAVGPFLRSNLYELGAKNVLSAYVVGRVKIFDADAHQLAFTGPEADWQLWVTGGAQPRFVRAEIVNKKLKGEPRTIIQFVDWNLSPSLPAGEFTFKPPVDARKIGVLTASGGR